MQISSPIPLIRLSEEQHLLGLDAETVPLLANGDVNSLNWLTQNEYLIMNVIG